MEQRERTMKLPHRSFMPAVVLAVSLTLIGIAGLAIAAGGGAPRGTPIVGPCDGYRLATPQTYQSLALKLVYDPLNRDRLLPVNATPERVEAQIARIAGLRASVVPSLGDACLAAHVTDWLDHYEREARTAMARKAELNGFESEYDKRRAEEEDQVRALAARLGVKR